MNVRKLFNGLIILTLLLPALLTGSPDLARAATIPPYALNGAEAADLGMPFSGLSAVGGSVVQGPPSAPAGVSTRSEIVVVLGEPDITVSPLSLIAVLNPGDTITRKLTISNVSTATDNLTWTQVVTPAVTWLNAAPGGGTAVPGASDTVNVNFNAPGVAGTYTTTLQVSSNDPDEPMVDVSVALTVTSACIPVSGVDFTFTPTSPGVGDTVTFTGSVLAGTPPITYTWDFGDGSTLLTTGSSAGSGQVVNHTYSAGGVYTVTLTAVNECPSQDIASQSVAVGQLPAAPTLNPIDNADGDGDYTVSWSASNGADVYTLQESDNASFAGATTAYVGSSTSTNVTGKSDGAYYYRVNASNEYGASGWSNVQSVVVSTAPPPSGDAYEPDDTCEQTSSIPTDGSVQRHTFHTTGDADWVSFQAISGTEYLVEALTPITSTADVVLEVYDACDALPTNSQGYAFAPDVRLKFEAPTTGIYYLRLLNQYSDAAGPDVTYHLSVRALGDEPTPGALVLVAGRYRPSDPLQSNIHNVTNDVYSLFRGNGYTGDRIYYLATDLNLDGDGDTWPDVDALVDRTKLEQAITQWAVDKVGPDRSFTLYFMDHGDSELFYLDGPNQTVSPDEIDGWLGTLEAAAPGVKVNVIVDACYAGSFIDLDESLSKPGRVVIASTGLQDAYASQNGAVFSDAFVGALERGMSLYGSFEEGKGAAYARGQIPWLDDDGDGVPNEVEDGQEAARRGFAYAGTLAGPEKWPPYVVWAQVGQVQAGQGVITAEVQDDKSVLSAWAVIYKPSYVPPEPGPEMVQETLPTVTLLDQNADGVYTSLYEGFDEIGEYRVVVYAVDGEGFEGRPREVEVRTGWLVYLPMVVRDHTSAVTFRVPAALESSQDPSLRLRSLPTWYRRNTR